jgi:hypothetical protein
MLLPIVIVRGIRVEPRMLYAPSACVILSLAMLAPRTGHALARAALALYLTLCATCLIGFQTLLRDRSRLDWAQAERLRAALPDPPRDCVFLPVSVAQIACPTGYSAFDRAQFGAWSRDAYGTSVLRHAFARADLSCKRLTPDLTFDERGLDTRVWVRPGFTQGTFETRRFTWDRIVPFNILADGTVQLIGTIRLRHPDGQETLVKLRATGPDLPLPTASPHPSDASPKATAPPPAPPQEGRR